MQNQCEKLGRSDPISIEEIQSFTVILTARLILKFLDKKKKKKKRN